MFTPKHPLMKMMYMNVLKVGTMNGSFPTTLVITHGHAYEMTMKKMSDLPMTRNRLVILWNLKIETQHLQKSATLRDHLEASGTALSDTLAPNPAALSKMLPKGSDRGTAKSAGQFETS